MINKLMVEAFQKKVNLRIDETGRLKYHANEEISEDLKKRIEDHREEITKILIKMELKKVNSVDNALKQDALLSPSQQRLWLLNEIEGNGSRYNICSALKIYGNLSVNHLKRALNSLADRHEPIRTCFTVDEHGHPRYKIRSRVDVPVQQTDLSKFPLEEKSNFLDAMIKTEQNKAFDLAIDVMLRVHLFRLSVNENVLLVTMHHIASDGWSMSILVKELSQIYTAYANGRPNPLEPLSVQYSDYAYWQRVWLQGKRLNQQLDYWSQKLASLPIVHSLPLDFHRPLTQSFTGECYRSEIHKCTVNALKEICRANNATLYVGMYTALSILISRLSNESDIVIGTPTANREQPEISGLIGFFVNTLVLRCNLSESTSFLEALSQCRDVLLEAFSNQYVPFDQVVEHLQPQRSLSHSALFQIMLVLQNNDAGKLELPGLGLKIEQIDLDSESSKYDLTIIVVEADEALIITWEYNKDLFSRSSIEMMAGTLNTLLAGLINAPNADFRRVPLLTESERLRAHRIGIEGDGRKACFSSRLLHEHAIEQIDRHPERIAVVSGTRILTYKELGEKSSTISQQLMRDGCTSGNLVAVVLHKGWEQVVAVLSILRSGAAYLPIDANLPYERVKLLIDLGEATHVLTTPELKHALFENINVKILEITDKDAHTAESAHFYPPRTTIEDLAYVTFTSGSTGVPKGVMTSHKGASNTIDDICTRFSLDEKDSVLALSSLGFDLSVFDIFGMLSVGGKIVIPSDSDVYEPLRWLELVEREKVTVWNSVPAFMQLQITHNPGAPSRSIRLVMLSGDWIPIDLPGKISELFPLALQVSLGGATEASIWSILHPLNSPQKNGSSVPYGKALTNQHVHVLQPSMEPAPTGVAGEIYIGGTGVSPGYWKDPQKTKESFVYCPWTNETLYKTGDLGRRLNDGTIELIGRIDHQIKLRGFRIELSEIEVAIRSHQDVSEVMVTAHGELDEGNITQLVAYIKLERHEKISRPGANNKAIIEEIKAFLRNMLPEYMVPASYIFLEKFPLNQNGKVDRKALPKIEISQSKAQYFAPKTEIELHVCRIWEQVLGVDQVGLDDNFFELGGHSLLIIKVVSLLRKVDVNIDARMMFKSINVRDLCLCIENTLPSPEDRSIAPKNLINAGSEVLTPDLLPLITLTQYDIDLIANQVPNGVTNIQDIYPLAPIQEGILFHNILDDGADPYVLSSVFRLKSEKILESLISALKVVVQRHDALRTLVLWRGLSLPAQVVCRNVDLNISNTDVSHIEDVKNWVIARIKSEKNRIDLDRPPLLRLEIFDKSGAGEKYIAIHLHHIISDHVGLEIVSKEIHEVMIHGAEKLATPIPFRNFIFDLGMRKLHLEQIAKPYFIKQLADIHESATPYNIKLNSVDELRLKICRYIINSELSEKIADVARLTATSSAVLFHAAWGLVTAVCSGSSDVILGTVLSGRMSADPANDGVFGVFINTLPVRIKLSRKSVAEYISFIKEQLETLIQFEHIPLPFAQKLAGLPARTPLFTSLINYRHSVSKQIADVSDLEEQDIYPIHDQEKSSYPFTLIVDDFGSSFEIEVQVDQVVNEIHLIYYVESALRNIVEALENSPAAPMSSINIIPDFELELLSDKWQGQNEPFPDTMCVHELFEHCTEHNQESVAVVCEGKELSYGALNRKANQLAHYLLENAHLKPDGLVGICMERSLDMVVAVLGILKAGGAYVPLEPSLPKARLDYMLKDAKVAFVITQFHLHELNEQIAHSGIEVFPLDDAFTAKKLADCPSGNIDKAILGLDSRKLAYVIYTSGSTGRPKGVMIEHRSLVNRIHWMNKKYKSSSQHCFLQKTPFSFDVSVWEFLWPLTTGAKLVMAKPLAHKSPEELSRLIQAHSVTKIHFVPSMLGAMLKSGYLAECHSLQQIFCSGEKLNANQVKMVHDTCEWVELHNLYGPTEAAIDVTSWDCSCLDEKDSIVPIGSPIINTKILILNEDMNFVPTRITGNLYIAGVGLARGYLNNHDLTKERFIDDPSQKFSNNLIGNRIYQTGDLARWLPDGNIEYVGRSDEQVKIRGFRVELGEIEHVLRSSELVEEAVVLSVPAGEDRSSERLVAYVKPSKDWELRADKYLDHQQFSEELRTLLASVLPEYMLPSAYTILSEFTLNQSGKIDKRALAEIDEPDIRVDFVSPNSNIEREMCEVWQSVLGLERVGITDNFFDLGGDSISAIELLNRLCRMGLNLTMKDLIKHPMIKDLSLISDAKRGTDLHDPYELNNFGALGLPNKQRLFKNTFRNHWNFSAVFLILQKNEEKIRHSIEHLIRRHEGLRLYYSWDKGVIYEHVDSFIEGSVYMDTVDFSETENKDEIKHLIEKNNNALQSSLDLTGRLFRFVLYKCPASEPDRLLIIFHHALIDAYSLDIIFRDFQLCLTSTSNISPREDDIESVGISLWNSIYHRYIAQLDIKADLHYWANRPWTSLSYLCDFPDGILLNESEDASKYGKTFKCARHLQIAWAETEKAGTRNSFRLSDVILSAFVTAISSTLNNRSVYFDLEVSGRDILIPGISLGNTVGWISDYVPIVARAYGAGSNLERARQYKQWSDSIYDRLVRVNGIRCYRNQEFSAVVGSIPKPEFCISYDTVSGIRSSSALLDAQIAPADESPGLTHNSEQLNPIWASFIKITNDGNLTIEWYARDNIYRTQTVEKVLSLWSDLIIDAIQEASQKH